MGLILKIVGSLFLRVVILHAASGKMAPLHLAEERDAGGRYLVALLKGHDVDVWMTVFESKVQKLNLQKAKVIDQIHGDNTVLMTEFDNKALSEVRNMEGVEYVEEDGVVSQEAVLVTEDRTFENDVANWGLDRIDQRSNRLDGKFFINGSGNGVHVYILDSGLRPTHKDIVGRAHVAYDAYGGSGFDIDGHGTHCAGIVAGTEYGVAKKANVYGIRIIRGHHKGSVSGVIRGLNWVKLNRKRPCVVSMSISGTASKTLNRSARELFNSGCVLVAAASNSNTDSCTRSPAQMPEVITVAASDRNDFRTSFSDYGDCVDLFAPGSHILSLDYKSDDATIPLSGTSMATPFVSGAAAILLEKGYPYNEVAHRLRELSTKGVIQHKGYHTPNRLLYLD